MFHDVPKKNGIAVLNTFDGYLWEVKEHRSSMVILSRASVRRSPRLSLMATVNYVVCGYNTVINHAFGNGW